VPKFVKASDQLISQWPEAFEDLYITTMPVAYIQYVIIFFHDGTVWEINIKDNISATDDFESVAEIILDTIKDFREDISQLGFKLDVDKLKSDVKQESKKIL
jgi:DNA-binding protein YbaB